MRACPELVEGNLLFVGSANAREKRNDVYTTGK
jgi:hypothetical protein